MGRDEGGNYGDLITSGRGAVACRPAPYVPLCPEPLPGLCRGALGPQGRGPLCVRLDHRVPKKKGPEKIILSSPKDNLRVHTGHLIPPGVGVHRSRASPRGAVLAPTLPCPGGDRGWGFPLVAVGGRLGAGAGPGGGGELGSLSCQGGQGHTVAATEEQAAVTSTQRYPRQHLAAWS